MDPLGPKVGTGVVYIESIVFYSSLNIHHQIVHTSHFPISSMPKPGGGVYLWGPNLVFQFKWSGEAEELKVPPRHIRIQSKEKATYNIHNI